MRRSVVPRIEAKVKGILEAAGIVDSGASEFGIGEPKIRAYSWTCVDAQARMTEASSTMRSAVELPSLVSAHDPARSCVVAALHMEILLSPEALDCFAVHLPSLSQQDHVTTPIVIARESRGKSPQPSNEFFVTSNFSTVTLGGSGGGNGWGNGNFGQLGSGQNRDSAIPVAVMSTSGTGTVSGVKLH